MLGGTSDTEVMRVNFERDKNGRVKVYDIALSKWVWTQVIDARQGIERGQFSLSEPAPKVSAGKSVASRGE